MAPTMTDCLTEYAGKNCPPGDGERAYNALSSILTTPHAYVCKPIEATTTTSTPTVTTGRTTTTSYVTTQETTSKPNDTLTTQSVNDATTTYSYTTTTSASTKASGNTTTTQPPATTVTTETPNLPTTTQAPPPVEYECYKCNSGCNINKPNRKCPANGKMRFNTPTTKCTGLCVSFVNTTKVVRGCSDGVFPDLTTQPTNTCLTHNFIFMCFCTGDRCNMRNMEKEIV